MVEHDPLDGQNVGDMLAAHFGVHDVIEFQTFVEEVDDARSVAEELRTRYGVSTI